MAAPIVRAAGPPDQDERPVIRSWRTEGYRLELRDAGNRTAEIVCTLSNESPQTHGSITFDTALNRHIIEWNRSGCLALEQYKRDFWDTQFYYSMAEYNRSLAAS